MNRLATNKSQRRRLAQQSRDIVQLVRKSRSCLHRVTELVSQRSAEVLALDETGETTFEKRKLNEEERIQRLQVALSWLGKAEEMNRQLRAQIERALEKEWKSI